MSSTTHEGDAVPPQAKGSWSSFIRSLASFNGDLSSMTAPPFILSTTSLTEFSAYWAEHPSVLVAPALEKDPQKRALAVLKWFLTTLKPSYSSRNEKLGSEKKPLNPFLGELFLGKWQDDVGETTLVSEQVSHHPPVTAYSIRNAQHGVHLQGYNAQKASFSRRIDVKQIGHAELHLAQPNESYIFTLPSLHIEGLITGSPFVELNGKTYIQSSSGYTARIEYSGRGWLSGKKNSFTACLYETGKSEKDALYNIEGQWTGEFVIKDAKKKVVDTWKAGEHKSTPLQIPMLEEQDELESRRAWKGVADAIVKGDMNTVAGEKGLIEDTQRRLRRKEKEENREWERVFFTRMPKNELMEGLARKVHESLEPEKTNGIWTFDEQKAARAQKPYRPQTMPRGGVQPPGLERQTTGLSRSSTGSSVKKSKGSAVT